MRVTTLRFSDVTEEDKCNPEFFNARGVLWRDLWAGSSTQAVILGFTAPSETLFTRGTHEAFFIVATPLSNKLTVIMY
jgi:hypothetical protein